MDWSLSVARSILLPSFFLRSPPAKVPATMIFLPINLSFLLSPSLHPPLQALTPYLSPPLSILLSNILPFKVPKMVIYFSGDKYQLNILHKMLTLCVFYLSKPHTLLWLEAMIITDEITHSMVGVSMLQSAV